MGSTMKRLSGYVEKMANRYGRRRGKVPNQNMAKPLVKTQIHNTAKPLKNKPFRTLLSYFTERSYQKRVLGIPSL